MRKTLFGLACITLALFSACGNGENAEGAAQTLVQPPAQEAAQEAAQDYGHTADTGGGGFAAGAGSQNAVAISAASDLAFALMEDGSLWAWGAGRVGWDGVPISGVGDGTAENRDRPVKIMEDVAFAVAGHIHSLAITTDGTLWAWGSNWWGQIGDGTTENRLAPVPVMSDVVYAAMPQRIPNSHVMEGQGRSYAIRADGSLWAWGQSGQGENAWEVALGDGSLEDRLEPVRILENATRVVPTHNGGLALTADGTLWRWHGSVFFRNEAGDWEHSEPRLSPQSVMGNVASVSDCGSFAITADGGLWTLPILGEPARGMENVVYATSAGGSHFAITADGTLWAWGHNRISSHWRPGPLLGDGTTTDRDAPVRILDDVAQIAVMGNSAYAITNDGGLWEWGAGTGTLMQNNPDFQIGEGHMWEFALENGFEDGIRWLLEDDGGTGLRLSPARILENAVSVVPTFYMLDHGWVRSARAFALTSYGEVWAWGENDVFNRGLSLLGDGSSDLRPSPVRVLEGRR